MNRFFSKLNLSDIKIKAEGNSFPPDADDIVQPENQIASDVSTAVESVPEFEDASLVTFEETEEAIVETVVRSDWETSEDVSYIAPVSNGQVTEIVSDGIVIGIGEVLKVSARSRPSAVAGAIAGVVREVGKAEVQAIGAGATNQAIKAVAIARDYLKETGIDAICIPAFIDVTIENEDRTAIRLVVEPR